MTFPWTSGFNGLMDKLFLCSAFCSPYFSNFDKGFEQWWSRRFSRYAVRLLLITWKREKFFIFSYIIKVCVVSSSTYTNRQSSWSLIRYNNFLHIFHFHSNCQREFQEHCKIGHNHENLYHVFFSTIL